MGIDPKRDDYSQDELMGSLIRSCLFRIKDRIRKGEDIRQVVLAVDDECDRALEWLGYMSYDG